MKSRNYLDMLFAYFDDLLFCGFCGFFWFCSGSDL